MSEHLTSVETEIKPPRKRRADGAVWSDIWNGWCWRDEDGVLHVDSEDSE